MAKAVGLAGLMLLTIACGRQPDNDAGAVDQTLVGSTTVDTTPAETTPMETTPADTAATGTTSLDEAADTAPPETVIATASPETSAEVAAIEAELRMTIEELVGLPADFVTIISAGDILAQRAIGDCFAESGVPYTAPPPTGGGYGGWLVFPFPEHLPMLTPIDDGLTPGGALASDFRWTQTLAAQEAMDQLMQESEREAAGLDDAGSAAIAAAATSCHPLLGDHVVSPGALRNFVLEGSFFDALAEGENDPHVRTLASKYVPCLVENGFDVADRAELIRYVNDQYFDRNYLPVEPGSEQAEAARQVYERAVSADQTCRQDAHDAALLAVQPHLADFLAQYGTEIEEHAANRTEMAAASELVVADYLSGSG